MVWRYYFGYQWKLGKNWYLDWQQSVEILVMELRSFAHQTLSEDDQEKIISFAEDIQNQFSDVEYEVNSQGARVWEILHGSDYVQTKHRFAFSKMFYG